MYNKLENYLSISTVLWHKSNDLINRFGRNALNKLWSDGKIEVRNGLNQKVVRWKN